MGFIRAIKTCFVKYIDFSGRARRAEFWWWFLFFILAPFLLFRLIPVGVLTAINAISDMFNTTYGWLFPFAVPLTAGYYTVASVFYLALFPPTFAVIARRLHDMNRSGWWLAIPHILAIPFLISFGKLIANEITKPSPLLLISSNLSNLAFIILLIALMFPGTKGDNRFGADPLKRIDPLKQTDE